MKNCVLPGLFLMAFTGAAFAQNVTVDVPNGYKVVVVPLPLVFHKPLTPPLRHKLFMLPRRLLLRIVRILMVRHLASVGEGMVIEHQIDDHHH